MAQNLDSYERDQHGGLFYQKGLFCVCLAAVASVRKYQFMPRSDCTYTYDVGHVRAYKRAHMCMHARVKSSYVRCLHGALKPPKLSKHFQRSENVLIESMCTASSSCGSDRCSKNSRLFQDSTCETSTEI